jgi:histidine triad (HIT) family protein
MDLASCLFCKIASKEIPVKIVYEDEYCVVFPDIAPQAPVHLIAIPKKHLKNLAETFVNDYDILSHLLGVLKIQATEQQVSEKGYRIVLNTNSEGGQSVYHLHFHLLGGRTMNWPPG